MAEIEMSDELDILVERVHGESLHYVPGDPLLLQFQGFCRGIIMGGGRHLVAEERKRLATEANRYLQELKYPESLFPV